MSKKLNKNWAARWPICSRTFLTQLTKIKMNQTTKTLGQVLSPAELENFDAYAEIELTETEQAQALFLARRQKYVAIKTANYKNQLATPNVRQKLTLTEMYQKVIDAGFIVDDFNKQIIWNLCRYFCGDVNGPYNLRKGIMLYGPVGCYKTSLMRFFAQNQTNSFVIFHVNDISAQFTKDGHDVITRYKNAIKTNNVYENYGQTDLGICFDDFGTEVDKKHFGNESNVMAEIILGRHNNHHILFGKTHITTNLNTSDIEERYGIRCRSRLREMVNLVEFADNSPDRRK